MCLRDSLFILYELWGNVNGKKNLGCIPKLGRQSQTPLQGAEKIDFWRWALPHRQKSIKEKHLYDSRLAFTPKLKRTHGEGESMGRRWTQITQIWEFISFAAQH